jgi:hypothetical protein
MTDAPVVMRHPARYRILLIRRGHREERKDFFPPGATRTTRRVSRPIL